MFKKQYFQADFKAVTKTEKGTLVRGYASTPAKDRQNDIVEPEAFRKTIGGNFAKNPMVLFQHKNDFPIGKVQKMTIDPNGLNIEALIVDENIEPKVEAGILKTFSIGYVPTLVEYRAKDGVMLNPETDWNRIYFEDGVTRTIKELELFEISIVTIPANPEATFAPKMFDLNESVKNFFELQKKEFLSTNKTDMEKKEIIIQSKDDDKAADEKEDVENQPEKADGVSDNGTESPGAEKTAEDEAAEKGDEGDAKETEDEKPADGAEADKAESEDEKADDEAAEEDAEDEADAEKEDAEDAEDAESEDESGEKGFTIDPKLVTADNLKMALDEVVDLRERNKRLALRNKEMEAELAKLPAKKAHAFAPVGIAPADKAGKTEKAADEKVGFKKSFFGNK